MFDSFVVKMSLQNKKELNIYMLKLNGPVLTNGCTLSFGVEII